MLIKDKYIKINIREYLALGADDDAGGQRLTGCSPNFLVLKIRMLSIF